jgi:hypothetical protein
MSLSEPVKLFSDESQTKDTFQKEVRDKFKNLRFGAHGIDLLNGLITRETNRSTVTYAPGNKSTNFNGEYIGLEITLASLSRFNVIIPHSLKRVPNTIQVISHVQWIDSPRGVAPTEGFVYLMEDNDIVTNQESFYMAYKNSIANLNDIIRLILLIH